MRTINFKSIFCLIILSLFATHALSANMLNSGADYSIVIAVTINEDDNIMGKLEYSNHTPLYPLQLVTFNPVGGVIHAEPYLFELLEKQVVSKNLHRIKCRSINDKYGSAEIKGTIDFSNELKPKIHLVNARGDTYISNLSEDGKKAHMKYIPKIWLGN